MRRSSRLVQYLLTLCVSLAYVVLGVTSSWPSAVKNKFSDNETSVYVSDFHFSWMLSMNPIGFTLGSLSSGFVTDYLGRRTTILGSAFPVLIGTIIVVFAKKAWLLYITTFTWSFGTAMLVNVSGMYLAEVIDKDIRGTLNLATRITYNLGHLLMMAIGPRIPYETLNYCLIVLPVGYFFICWWIPESPFYYLKEGKDDLARRELLKIRGGIANQELEEELKNKKKNVDEEMARSILIKELFFGKEYKNAIIIASGLKLTQVLTGGTTIKNYLGTTMRNSNVPKERENTVFLVYGISAFLVGIVSTALVDKVGRRPLLIYSFFGTGACLSVVGVYFFFQEVYNIAVTSLSSYVYVPVVYITVSNIISTLGFNSVTSLVISEIFPLNVKALMITLLNVFGGILGFIVAKSYQNIVDYLGSYTLFWIYTGIAIIGGVFSLLKVPETKGQTLSDIQLILQGKVDTEEGIQLNSLEIKDNIGEVDEVNTQMLATTKNIEP